MPSRDHNDPFDPHDPSTRSASPTLAERLLTLPLLLQRSSRAEEILGAAARGLARELGADALICRVEDTTPEPTEAEANRLRLEIRERDEILAYLDLARPTPFTREEGRLLTYVALSLGERLTELSERTETRLLTELSAGLPASENLEDAARQAVHILAQHLSVEAGMLLMDTNTGFRCLAAEGNWPQGLRPTPFHLDIARACTRELEPRVHSGTLLACPVGVTMPVRYVLLLRFRNGLLRRNAHHAAVRQATRTLAPHLDALRYAEALEEFLELHQASEEVTTEELYERALDAAIRLVPGSDSGTLLVRRSRSEPFVFQAARGFDLTELQRSPLPAAEVRAWYGADEAGWRRGRPRIVRCDRADIGGLGRTASPHLDPCATRYDRIQATLCLPVRHEGEVMAVLNLDNQGDPDALGRDSREIAHLFGPTLASLLHRQHTRDLLLHAALTDELTGLKNRRAFDDALARELARRERAESEMSVLLMDLTGFKEVNDEFGHDAGDEALSDVAQALRASVRQTDVLSRWGGDEFAAILIAASAGEAAAMAERVREAVAGIRIRGRRLGIDIGIATAPGEGVDAAALLALADERMYENKRDSV